MDLTPREPLVFSLLLPELGQRQCWETDGSPGTTQQRTGISEPLGASYLPCLNGGPPEFRLLLAEKVVYNVSFL